MKIKKRYKLAILFLIIALLVFFPHDNLVDRVGEVVSQGTILEKTSGKQKENLAEIENKKALREDKRKLLLQTVGNELAINDKFGVSVFDINNSEAFGINEEEQFHAASVMKLAVAVTAFSDITAGKYSLSNTVTNNLQQMINQSNNNSWEYFNQLQGFNHQQDVVDSLGLSGIKIWGNLMSTKGVGELLLKLYKGEILTEDQRKLLFNYMQNTETENRISPGIPEGVNFYHKTGTFEGGVHDAAIVIHPKNPFILVIFTNDKKGTPWETRFKVMQNTTALIYNYFSEI